MKGRSKKQVMEPEQSQDDAFTFISDCIQEIKQPTASFSRKVSADSEQEKIENLRVSLKVSMNDPSSLESSLSGITEITTIKNHIDWLCLSELFIAFLKLPSRSITMRNNFNRKIQLILSSPHCESIDDLSMVIVEMDKHITSLKDLSSTDRLSIFVFMIEKIIQNHSKNIFEIIRICATLAASDKHEYLEGLSLLIQSQYNEQKSTRVKAQNGERIDCINMIILDLYQRIQGEEAIGIITELPDKSTNHSKLNRKKKEDNITEENSQLKAYELAVKNITEFLRSLFKRALLSTNTVESQSQQQQQQSSSASKKEINRVQQFLVRLSNDTGRQLYSTEFGMAGNLLHSIISIVKSYVEKNTMYQNNAFLIEITKTILKSAYFDTISINELANDMSITVEKPFTALAKKQRQRVPQEELKSSLCNICGDVNVVLSLKQNEDILVMCGECSNLKSSMMNAVGNLNLLMAKIPSAFETALTYYSQHMFSVSMNQNYMTARASLMLSGMSIQQHAGNGSEQSQQSQSSTLVSVSSVIVPEQFGCNLELDFMDFIYKVKVQTYFRLPEMLGFLLKYICALTDDNSTLIRNKSLLILKEIEGFNRSDVFEKYLGLRRLDSAVGVRLTALRILEQLFTVDDQTQYESDDEYKARKDRYFKMIIERFNDKEAAVRGAVLSFISDNVTRLRKEKQLKVMLIRQLVLRLQKDSTSFQLASLQILTQIYFPTYSGVAHVSGNSKKAPKLVRKAKKVVEGKHSRKRASLSYLEEEMTLSNILELQKVFEVTPETLLRIALHFQEHQEDSNVFLSRLLSVSLKYLDEQINIKETRQYVLGVIEVISKLKTGCEMIKEFEIFVKYFEQLVGERALVQLKDKQSRAELNLCLIIILDILANLFQKNALAPTPSAKTMVGRLETLLITMMSKEGNIYVLKKLVEVSAHSVNYVSMNVQRVLEVFGQRYGYLRTLLEDDQLEYKVQGESAEAELLVFRISMSIHIMSIYAYHFFSGSLRAMNVTLQDLVALLVQYISFSSEKIQAASFENLALLWEKEYELIFTCQDILADLIENPKTSEKLLVTVYTIFHNYILKHISIINSKASKMTTLKSKQSMNDEQEDEEQQYEHITSVIRDLVIRSYENFVESPCLQLKQSVLRLLGLLVREKLVLFQQIGVRIIPLICDADPLVKTLANAIIQDQAMASAHPIGLCLKAGLKRTAQFIDENNKVFGVTEVVSANDHSQKHTSLFERLNVSLRIKSKSDSEVLIRKSLELIEDIQEWSYEDHEIAFFAVMLVISLNTISRKDLLIAIECLRNTADKLFHEVNDFLKSVSAEANYDDENDIQSDQEKQFIKANVLLMCLVCAHVLIVQSGVFPAKYHQLDVFYERLEEQIGDNEGGGAFHDGDDNGGGEQSGNGGERSLLRKFDGDPGVLESMSDLFLEQMREFDCSDEVLVSGLRAKIKHLMFDFVEAEIFKIIDIAYTKTDAMIRAEGTKKSGKGRIESSKERQNRNAHCNEGSQKNQLKRPASQSCNGSKKSRSMISSSLNSSMTNASEAATSSKPMSLRRSTRNRVSLKNKILEAEDVYSDDDEEKSNDSSFFE